MEKLKTFFASNFFRKAKKVFLILVAIYLVLAFVRAFDMIREDKTKAIVEKIHNTKLTMADVTGDNLPPDPGDEADKTVEGIDANENGIRDDVELAIFREYPDSAKTRAVLLQYALALQMQFNQEIVNQETVIAVTQEGDRAYLCIGEIFERNDENEEIMEKYFIDSDLLRSFVEEAQVNTLERENKEKDFFKKIGSYNSLEHYCDIDYSKLSN